MSTLLKNIAIGAVAGALAHTAIVIAEKRVANGKPAVPSALSAGLTSLLPLAKGLAQDVIQVVDKLEANMVSADDQHDGDGGDDAPADTDQTAGNLALSTTPAA